MDLTTSITRSWQDQPLPAPLLPAHLSETLALGLLRRQPATSTAVAVGPALIQTTLAQAGIPTTLLLLTGPTQPGGPDVLYQADPDSADRFDLLLSQVFAEPASGDAQAGSILRQRTLAALRLKALGRADHYVQLPDLDAALQVELTHPEAPRLGRWLLIATPMLLLAFLLFDVYISFMPPPAPLWPLLVLPLLGAFGFGAVLYKKLWGWRQEVAQAWLARPARLRPDATGVARSLAQAPFALLWWPLVIMLLSFAGLFVAILTVVPTHPAMVFPPLTVGLLLLFGVSWWRARGYVRRTMELIQALPASLLPQHAPAALWQSYSYF